MTCSARVRTLDRIRSAPPSKLLLSMNFAALSGGVETADPLALTVLDRLSLIRGVTVAIISTRPAADTRERLFGLPAFIAGRSGLECVDPCGRVLWAESPAPRLTILRAGDTAPGSVTNASALARISIAVAAHRVIYAGTSESDMGALAYAARHGRAILVETAGTNEPPVSPVTRVGSPEDLCFVLTYEALTLGADAIGVLLGRGERMMM